MRKFLRTLLIVAILIIGFFFFGGDVSVEDGIPQISFSGSWETAGEKLGNALGNLLDGFLSGIKTSDTIKDIIPNASTPTQPTITAPEIPEGYES